MKPKDSRWFGEAPVEPRWERVANWLERIAVPGGWLYRTFTEDFKSVALVFVPRPPEVESFFPEGR